MELYTDYIMIYYNMIVQVLVMIAFYLVSSIISERIQRSYHAFAIGKTQSGMAGFEAAEKILDKNAIYDIRVLPGVGFFSDSFSRIRKRITLSKKVYGERSITASAIAAQKTAHAVVASRKFSLMSLLVMLKPIARIVTPMYIPLLLVSTIINIVYESDVMLYVFIAILVLQVITLPVVFYASRIAIRELKETDILNEEERYGAKKVLRSLSFTHISTIIITLIYVIRF